jgi:hypothetical protein
MEKEHEEKFVEVAVVTTSGTYPSSGYNKMPAHQKVRVDLEKAAHELKITNTENWIAQVNGNQINVDQSYIENNLSGEFYVDWGPRQGGGGSRE